MVNSRGGIAEPLSYSPSNHNDEPNENGHCARNGSIRSSPLCIQSNGKCKLNDFINHVATVEHIRNVHCMCWADSW